MKRRGWVLINYPVVTSHSTDNSGGYAHLLGNVQTYQRLGFKVLCIGRFSWRLMGRIHGALCLNIIPGAAVPAARSDAPATPQAVSAPGRATALRRLRGWIFERFMAAVLTALRPEVLHQRANLRFMTRRRRARTISVIELNDRFAPDLPCDGYLTVTPYPNLAGPQFARPWPVATSGEFDENLFMQRLQRIAESGRGPSVLLFGTGGVRKLADAVEFLQGHPWLRQKNFSLHVYGATPEQTANSSEVVALPWTDENALNLDRFDLGLIFYSESIYDDARLALGSPTKLWKYVDWSLPCICNRAIVSSRFLGGFDQTGAVLTDRGAAGQYANYLRNQRRLASVDGYASELIDFLNRIGLPI